MTRRNHLGRKLCGVHPCSSVIQEWKLMCVAHWRRVPSPMRDNVWRALRAWQEHGGADKLHELQRAQHLAIMEAS